MKKLPMHQLIEWLEDYKFNLAPSDEGGITSQHTIINEVKAKARRLLKDEKAAIVEAFNQGYREGEISSLTGGNFLEDVAEFDDANIYLKSTYE